MDEHNKVWVDHSFFFQVHEDGDVSLCCHLRQEPGDFLTVSTDTEIMDFLERYFEAKQEARQLAEASAQ